MGHRRSHTCHRRPGAGGENAPWEKLYLDYHRSVESYFSTHAVPTHDVEDLTQEVFAELMAGKLPQEPRSYLRAIARNLLYHYRSKRARLPKATHDRRLQNTTAIEYLNAAPSNRGPAEPAFRIEFEETMARLAARLPVRSLEAVKLRFVEGLSTKEVAEEMGCSAEAVRKRLRRAREIMSTVPGKEGYKER